MVLRIFSNTALSKGRRELPLFMMGGLLSSLLLISSCAKQNSQVQSDSSNMQTSSDSSTRSSSLLLDTQNIAQVMLVSPSETSGLSQGAQPQSDESILSSSVLSTKVPVQLLCIPNSLNDFGVIADSIKLFGTIQDKNLLIDTPFGDLVSQCLNEMNLQNVNFKLAKFGIRYNNRDYELKIDAAKFSQEIKNYTNIFTNQIEVTSNFIDSIQTNPAEQVQLYCSLNQKELSDGQEHPFVFSGKYYFDFDKVTNEHNILFLNISRETIANWSLSNNEKYTFGGIPFEDCIKQQGYFYTLKNGVQFKKVYFLNDSIPQFDGDEFLTSSLPFSPDNIENRYLVCYFMKNDEVFWHWGFTWQNGKPQMVKLEGVLSNGNFKINESDKQLKQICQNYSQNYSSNDSEIKDKNAWSFVETRAAAHYWSLRPWNMKIEFSGR